MDKETFVVGELLACAIKLNKSGSSKTKKSKRFSICMVWNTRSKQWLIIMFSSNASGSKKYTNVSLTENS